jgi:arylformamidase
VTSRALIDVSPPITPALAVFPGDTAMTREVLMDFARGDHIRLSTIRATVHLGAHADAPSHYGLRGRPIDEQPLDLYVGPCQVIACAAQRGRCVRAGDLQDEVRRERILLKTGTFPDPQRWNGDFAGLEPQLVDALHERGVRLVGIDTPSVDPASAKDLVAHARFLAHDMAIIEGLVLAHVAPGDYELIALPLKLVGADGSPVRAVLRG